jgi:hypothetical protein
MPTTPTRETAILYALSVLADKEPFPTVGQVTWQWFGRVYLYCDKSFVERNARYFLPDLAFDMLDGYFRGDEAMVSYRSRAEAVAALVRVRVRLEGELDPSPDNWVI